MLLLFYMKSDTVSIIISSTTDRPLKSHLEVRMSPWSEWKMNRIWADKCTNYYATFCNVTQEWLSINRSPSGIIFVKLGSSTYFHTHVYKFARCIWTVNETKSQKLKRWNEINWIKSNYIKWFWKVSFPWHHFRDM